jgi:hypothetical protein
MLTICAGPTLRLPCCGIKLGGNVGGSLDVGNLVIGGGGRLDKKVFGFGAGYLFMVCPCFSPSNDPPRPALKMHQRCALMLVQYAACGLPSSLMYASLVGWPHHPAAIAHTVAKFADECGALTNGAQKPPALQRLRADVSLCWQLWRVVLGIGSQVLQHVTHGNLKGVGAFKLFELGVYEFFAGYFDA